MNLFYVQVYEIVEKIPYGKVVPYVQIARMLGAPTGARMVGRAMRHCPDHLPWHRVVMADGSITGGIFADTRRQLLELEDIPFLSDGRVNMDLCRWDGNTEH